MDVPGETTMFDSVTVDIVIGICFLYVFLSLICSIVTEWISRALAMRSKLAPFRFDVLSKVSNLRSAGRPPGKTSGEGSSDG